MTYKINSQNGRSVNVTFKFDDGETKTKDMDIQPYGVDAVDGLGRPIIVLKDPFDDIDSFFNEYMQAYARGKAQSDVPTLTKGKFIDPVAEISKRESVDEAVVSDEPVA
jgi:hypothetical protein